MSLARPPLDPPPAADSLDRHWLSSHIPHQGRMCLLDEVLAWDMAQIRCRASSHRLADHPLRAGGRLGAACGVEYAGQAMAAHGALIAALTGIAARTGYLASVRDLQMHVTRLDDLAGDLLVSAWRLAGDEDTALYGFALACADRALLSGRAGIVFGALAAGEIARGGP